MASDAIPPSAPSRNYDLDKVEQLAHFASLAIDSFDATHAKAFKSLSCLVEMYGFGGSCLRQLETLQYLVGCARVHVEAILTELEGKQ